MVGTVAYRLTLPPSLSDVHIVFYVSTLRKYTLDPTHVVDWDELVVDVNGTFEEGPVRIMDSRDQVLRRKTVGLVKCYGSTKEWRRQHWNLRARCVPIILILLRTKVHCLVI